MKEKKMKRHHSFAVIGRNMKTWYDDFFIFILTLKFKRRLVIFSTSFNYVSIIASNYMEIMEGYRKVC